MKFGSVWDYYAMLHDHQQQWQEVLQFQSNPIILHDAQVLIQYIAGIRVIYAQVSEPEMQVLVALSMPSNDFWVPDKWQKLSPRVPNNNPSCAFLLCSSR